MHNMSSRSVPLAVTMGPESHHEDKTESKQKQRRHILSSPLLAQCKLDGRGGGGRCKRGRGGRRGSER